MLNLNINQLLARKGISVLAYILNEMIQQTETNVPRNIFFDYHYNDISAYVIKNAEAKEQYLSGYDDPESLGELLLRFEIKSDTLSKYAAKEKVRALFV